MRRKCNNHGLGYIHFVLVTINENVSCFTSITMYVRVTNILTDNGTLDKQFSQLFLSRH